MSKGGYIGYTYQKHVTELFLTKMDTEREIDAIEVEATTDDKFDDLVINCKKGIYQIQIKDISGLTLKDIKIEDNQIFINKKTHKLSNNTNIIFFKQIDIIPNSEILGLSALKISDLYFVSLNRAEIDDIITHYYNQNPFRKSIIQKFFSNCLDNRKWKIEKCGLPIIDLFNTKLTDTINIDREIIDFENILHVEGKPGIGKSHFVEFLQTKYPDNILYRFWVSEQDPDKEERVKFQKFLFNFSKNIFSDICHRSENEILAEIKSSGKTVIIDGLDHVKNYNPSEFEQFVAFINKLKDSGRVLVLSRPIENELGWKKQLLTNWNRKQTEKVLEELFHITDYDIKNRIFNITDGYPIIIKYVAEHFKNTKTLPELDKLSSLDSYYNQIIKDTRIKSSLKLFLCSRAYFMASEISMFLEEDLANIVNEFIDAHPYLFEIRLNRISLFHDSFTTYLRNQNIDYINRQNKVNELVFNAIMSYNKRFLSRFSSFSLSLEQKRQILIKFTSMQAFKELMLDVVDFEAVQSFYTQLREELEHFKAHDLEIINYYDLSLIINIVNRDHVSTINTFQHIYIIALLLNGYTEEDITSSKYLFAMLYYQKTDDATLLFNATSNDHFATDRFIVRLENEIATEERYFTMHDTPFSKQVLSEMIEQKYNLTENLPKILTNAFVHNSIIDEYSNLLNSINAYFNEDDDTSSEILRKFLAENEREEDFASYVLISAKQNIWGLGKDCCKNDYLNLSLKGLIQKNKHLSSFDLRDEIHNYIRLSVYQQREIDISSISMFWTKYYSHKDYTFRYIGTALTIFEDKALIGVEDSCKLIKSIQGISERRYNHLFNDYIQQHPVGIIEFLYNNFNWNDLLVEWLDLPSNYINVLPDFIFQNELIEKLRYHSVSNNFDFEELVNVFQSNRLEELKYVLRLWNYKVSISNSHTLKEWLLSENIEIKVSIKNENEYTRNSEGCCNQGILTIGDKEFILKNKLSCYDVAGFADDWHSVLANLEIYKLFERESVVENIQKILYNAILGKVRSINFYCSLYYLPGNIPKLIADYIPDKSFDELFQSFSDYVQLSLFELKTKAEVN